jgi:hypothetical protein
VRTVRPFDAVTPFGASAARWRAAALVWLGLALSNASHASLGEPVNSVAGDHAAMHGTALTITPMAGYDRHEITTAEGTQVHEYATPEGSVFAVAWSGAVLPDLKSLLASHYAEYASAAREHRSSHHVFTMKSDGLELRLERLPRGFAGTASVPALVPAGVRVEDLD